MKSSEEQVSLPKKIKFAKAELNIQVKFILLYLSLFDLLISATSQIKVFQATKNMGK